MPNKSVQVYSVLKIPLLISDLNQTVDLLLDLASQKTQGYVCALSVHTVTLAQSIPGLFEALQNSFFNCPDGRPLVWAGMFQGTKGIHQIRGQDVFSEVFRRSAVKPFRHFLFGGKPGVAEKLKNNLEQKYPAIQIVGTYCPPFRKLSLDEEKEIQAQLEILKPDFFWVGLGTPKQEQFCAAYSKKWKTGIMVSVGAAFDFHSGNLSDSPFWVQRAGLQWIHRLIQDPRRLWKRYFLLNPLFIYLLVKDLLFKKSKNKKT